MSSSLKTASVLAFEKKICNSDALMYEGLWRKRHENEAWKPLHLHHKDIRGTISNRLKSSLASDPLKMDAEIQKANLQAVDMSALSFEADTLKVVFTLRVIGNVAVPTVCNNQSYQKELMEKVEDYLREHQCQEIALRYAENIANARYLWRNRLVAEEIEVKVSLFEGDTIKNRWTFDASHYNLRKFSTTQDLQLKELGAAIQQGLMGTSYIFLKVEAFARIGAGQEVFPSQELVRDGGTEKYKKSKVLYSVEGVAAMHSQKIGNALRTIDTWYPAADEFGPISIEPYGSVTSRGVAYRQPKDKMDFYTLLDNWILKGNPPTLDQQHYVIACLIRGGVFGEKE